MKWFIVVLLLILNVPIYIMLFKCIFNNDKMRTYKNWAREKCDHECMVRKQIHWIKGIILVITCFLIVYIEFNIINNLIHRLI